MPNIEFHCHGCGRPFAHQPGADLFCSPECAEAHEAKSDEAQGQLRAAGFRRYLAAPNLWEKGGTVISIEQVLREGLENALTAHTRALEARTKR